MCGRYAVTLPPEAMAELFRTLNRLDFPPRYNIAPTQPIVTVLNEHGRRIMKLMRWGLVPGWVKEPRDFPLLINARVESLPDKPAFRDALKHGRCVVPASGYFEWHTGPDGKSRQPYYITRKDGQPIALAGLYAIWAGPNGEEVDTAATITVPANAELSGIHDRMPAVLVGEAIEQWLDTGSVGAKEAAQLALPLEEGVLRYHPVGKAIGSSKVDGPELIVPIEAERPAPGKPKRAAAGGSQMSLF